MTKGKHPKLPPVPEKSSLALAGVIESAAECGNGELVVFSGNFAGCLAQFAELVMVDQCRIIDTSQEPPWTLAERLGDQDAQAILDVAVAGSSLAGPIAGLSAVLGKAAIDIAAHHYARRTSNDGAVDVVGLLRDLVWSLPADVVTVVSLGGLRGGEGRRVLERLEFDRHNKVLVDKPIVVCFGIGDARRLGYPSAQPDGSGLPVADPMAEIAARLTESGVPGIAIPYLTAPRLAAWLGSVDSALADALLAVTGGEDILASQLWGLWKQQGFIDFTAGSWRADGDDEPLAAQVRDMVHERLPSPSRQVAFDVLTWASFQRAEFSGEAVAKVVAADHGLDADDVVDVLDSLCPRRGERAVLIDTADSLRGIAATGSIGTWWTYRFTSRLFHAYFRNRRIEDTPDEDAETRSRYRRRLLDALVEEPVLTNRFAADVAELAAADGRKDLADQATKLAAALRRSAELHQVALGLLAMAEACSPAAGLNVSSLDDDLLQDRLVVLCEDLALAAGDLVKVGLIHLAVRCAETSLALMPAKAPPSLLALSNLHVGLARTVAGTTVLAVDPLREAVSHFRRVLSREPTPPNRRNVGISLGYLGNAVGQSRSWDEAVNPLSEAVKQHARVLRDTGTSQHRRELAISQHRLGEALLLSQSVGKAVGVFTEAAATFEQLVALAPTAGNRADLAGTLRYLGEAVGRSRSWDEAIGPLSQAVTLYRQLLVEEPTGSHQRDLGVALRFFGEGVGWSRSWDDAIGPLNEAVTLHRQVLSEDPTTGHRRDLGIGLSMLGLAFLRSGSRREAVNVLTEAVTIRVQVLEEDRTPRTSAEHETAVRYLAAAHGGEDPDVE